MTISRSNQLKQEMAALEAEIQELVGMPFNVGDQKQLGEILFERLGLPGGIKLDDGAYDVSGAVLDKLYSMHGSRLAILVLDWRLLQSSLEAASWEGMSAQEQFEEIRRMIREDGDFAVPQEDGTLRKASEVLADLEYAEAFANLLDTF